MKIPKLFAMAAMAAMAAATFAAPGGGGPGGESGQGQGGESGQGQGGMGGGGSLTYDDFIAVTTNANCLVREGTLFGYTSSLASSVSPSSGVTALAHGVFAGNTAITAVNLANTSITEVPSDAFAGCTALQSVTLPASCTAIAANAFRGCTALSSISASGATSIGHDAFRDCSALTAIDLPATVGSYAFAASGLTSVDLDGVSPGEGAFAGCTALGTVSNLPSDLPAALFAGCTALDVADWSGVSTFGQASLAGIPATELSISTSAEVGEYAFAAAAATVVTTLTGELPSYADTSFLGRQVSYTSGGDVIRIEANELVEWLKSVAADSSVTSVAVTQPESYATASLETWLGDSSNLAAVMAYLYGDEASEADILAVESDQSFTFTASTRASVAVSIVGAYALGDEFSADNLAVSETETANIYTATPVDETDACFARLKFEKAW